jgi:hypothetical protein
MQQAAESRSFASATFLEFPGTWQSRGTYTMRGKNMKDGIVIFTLLAVLVAGAAGCKVRVNKSDDGDSVKIATPFGGLSVNKDQTSAASLGLPAYPGSVVDSGNDGNKSANVDMGFGSFKLRVKVANYSSADNRDQVLAFYRKALSEYGTVIECSGGKPVGSPGVTVEGLDCDHSDHEHNTVHSNPNDLELKAGSARHQHLVVFHDGDSAATHFSLIALDLPHGVDNEQKGTN